MVDGVTAVTSAISNATHSACSCSVSRNSCVIVARCIHESAVMTTVSVSSSSSITQTSCVIIRKHFDGFDIGAADFHSAMVATVQEKNSSQIAAL